MAFGTRSRQIVHMADPSSSTAGINNGEQVGANATKGVNIGGRGEGTTASEGAGGRTMQVDAEEYSAF